MATTKAYELGQLGSILDVDSANNITLSGTLDTQYSGFDSDFTAKSTSDLSEGSNLYYTDNRADTRINLQTGSNLDLSSKSTTDLSEGSNLYYTDTRADARIAAATTADLTEGSNLYYTTARGDSDTGVYISGDRSYGNITTTGYIRGPSTFYIDPAPVDSDAGLLVIRGDLQVDGTTTTVNSTTVSINDKNIILADSAANASEADGAGITVNGASATITYDASNDEWDFNKDVNVTGTISSTQLINSGGTGTELAVVNDKAGGIGYYADNNGHTFKTYVGGWQTRLVIQEGGNVGIGTTSPTNNLTINTTSSYGGIDIDNGSYRHTIGNRGNTVDIIANRDNDDADGDIRFHVGGTGQEKMIIERSGDVGIGTLTPSNRLHVYKNNSGGAVYIDYQNTWTAANLSEFSNTPFVINSRASGAQLRFSGATDYVSIQSLTSDLSTAKNISLNPFGGNVGIGTTSPAANLEVANGDLAVSAGHIGIGLSTPSQYGSGVPTLHLQGTSPANTRAGAIYFTENTGDQTGAIYSTDGSDGYGGIILHSAQGDMKFSTGALQDYRIVIDTSGNVGIGTTSPSYPLHISGAGHQRLKIEKTDAGGDADLQISSRNDSTGWVLFHDRDSGNNSGAIKYVHSANNMHFRTNDVDDRLVIAGSGNVGIGTDSPGATLDIRGSGNFRLTNGLLFFTDNSTAGATNVNGAFIGMAHNAGYHVTSGDGGFGSAANSLVIGNYHTGGGDIILATTNAGPYPSGRVIIKENGQMGIGIDNPQQLLHVQAGSTGNGTIRVGGGAGLEISHDNAGVTLQRIDSLYRTTNAGANLQIRTGILTLHTGTSSTERMRIDADGDVSIDHDVAYSKLFVNGGGGTKKNLTTLATSNTGGAHPDLDTAAVVLGSPSGRNFVANNYIAGIAFDHLLNHQSALPFNYGQNPHGWIGLKMWDSPGYERSSLVFCTREDTTSASAKTIERMQITPYGNVGINRTSPPTTLTVNGTQRIEIDSNPSGLFSDGGDMHRDGALVFPVTASQITQSNSAGAGFCSMGWATTSRSGEQMHRNTSNRYMNGGSGTAMGFYIEAGTGEAGGICFDEDSTQVYGSSDNGTTFRIIDKDSDIVIMEMLQTSWNMSVRGSVNSSQSSFSGLSDRRIKKSFQDQSTSNILGKYANLDLKSYIRIDSYDYMKNNYENEEDLREVGLVAQEVEEIFPDVVGTTPVVDPRGMESVWEEIGEQLTEIKNVNQTQLLYKTIEAVQALIAENEALKARLDAAGIE